MPGVFVGSTALTTLGDIKIGGVDVQQVFVGSTQVFPVGGGDPSITFTWDPENDEALPGSTTFTRSSVKQEFDGTDFTELASGAIPENSAAVVGGAQGFNPGPAATNRITNSNDLTSGWSIRGVAGAAALGVQDLGVTASAMTNVGAAGADDFFTSAAGFTGGAGIAPSFWIRRVSTSGTLTIDNTQGSPFGRWTVDLAAIGAGWVNIYPGSPDVTEATAWTANGGNGGTQFYASSGSLDFDLTLADQEDTPFSTSSIITSGSTVSRVADVLDTGVAITTEFSALLDLTLPAVVGTGFTITLLGPDATAEDILRVDAVFDVIMDDGGTPVTVGTASAGARIKVSYGRDAAGRSASLDGATAVTGGAPGAGHVGDNFQLGSANGVNQSRSIHHATTLYNVRKSDAELEALAT